jgi:hypothetical protein
MTWPDVVRSVMARIHDGQAQDKELRAKWREKMTRVILRGFLKGDPIFSDHQEIDPEDAGLMERVAEQHARMTLSGDIDMIEIEFLDISDPNDRFFRIGTNPAGMGRSGRDQMSEPNLTGKYILLPDHSVREEPDLLAWARWMETADRHVRKENVGPWWVSTVFLGLDHGYGSLFDRDVPPVLFETMVFLETIERPITIGDHTRMCHDTLDDITHRYSTWEEALKGHNAIAARLRAALAG